MNALSKYQHGQIRLYEGVIAAAGSRSRLYQNLYCLNIEENNIHG